jgi:hypothetical protein
MSQTINALMALLQLLAGPAAGWLASWLFDLAREVWPREVCRGWPRWAAALLWEPHTATLSAPALAAFISGAAGLGVAVLRAQLDGSPLLPIVDSTLAAGVSALAGVLLATLRHTYETRRAAAQSETE